MIGPITTEEAPALIDAAVALLCGDRKEPEPVEIAGDEIAAAARAAAAVWSAGLLDALVGQLAPAVAKVLWGDEHDQG